jgi:hypothetical protein
MDLCVLFAMYHTAILSTISYSRAVIAPFSLLPFQFGELFIEYHLRKYSQESLSVLYS